MFSIVFFFAYTAHSAYRNMWSDGQSEQKIKMIMWKHFTTVQTEMMLYCFKAVYYGYFLTQIVC